MNKKKAIKLVTASALAASSFAAVAPFNTEAAVNVASSVKAATDSASKAFHAYYDVSLKGEAASVATVQAAVKSAQTSYQAAKKVVDSYKGKDKSVYLAKLAAASKNIKLAQDYVTAVNYAAGIKDTAQKLETATINKDINTVKDTQGTWSLELSKATGKIKALVSGTTAENAVIKAYLTYPNQVLPLVKAYYFADSATYWIDVKADFATAQARLDTSASYFAKGNATSTLGKAVSAYVDQVKADFVAKQAPKVESVSAIDGKTIEVHFSSAVDAATLKDVNKVDVITVVAGDSAAAPGTVSQELSADGKTLTLTAANFFKGDYTVKVPFEVVKGTNGQFAAPINAKVTVADTVAPVLSSAKATVKATTDKVTSVTLTFDEDVKSVEVVKIDGQNYTAVPVGNTVTISNLSLDPTKAYDVTVVNAKDAVDNTKDVQTAPLSVTVDNVAPSITSVVATGENTLKVTVDKALDKDTLAITGKVGTFVTNIASAVVNPKNNKEYTVTLDSAYLFKNGNSDTVTLTVAKEALVDALGNKNATEITKTVTVSKDAVAPAITKVDTTSNNGKVTAFTLTYTEGVTALDASKVYVVNSKGEILPLSSVATPAVDQNDNTKVVFTLANNAVSDTYSFDLGEGFVVDKSLAGNKSAKYSFSVNVTDAAQPVVTSFAIAGVTPVQDTANSFVVDFGTGVKVKATGTGSALNPLAYSVNGVVLPSNADVHFVTNNGVVDQTKVVVTLPAGFVKANDTAAVFRVTGVQTLDNKTSNPFIQTVAITDNTAPVVQSFTATDLSELTLTYSEAVKLVTPAQGATNDVTDEIKLFDSKGASVAINNVSVVNGKLVLTVADATAVTKVTTVETQNVDIVDAAGLAEKTGITLSK